MTEKNKVSIILPVYNSEFFLDRCIGSILNQTYENFEVIIINDGSTDKSLEIINRWILKDKRIKLINKKNEGVAKARNLGIEIASGEYIAFIDSDDYVSSHMLSTMSKIANEENADLVECSFNFVKDGEIINSPKFTNEKLNGNKVVLSNFLKRKNTVNAIWNKLYKASLFEKISFPNLKYGEDYLVNVLAHMYSYKKVTTSEKLYFYEDNINSAMNQKFNLNKLDNVYARVQAYDIVNKVCDNVEFLSLIALDILSNVVILETEMFVANKNKYEMDIHKKLSNLFHKYYEYVPIELIFKLKTAFMGILIVCYKLNYRLFMSVLFARKFLKRRD